MGRQIIPKPDGKYAIWSTIVDDFIMDDVTIEEYIAFRVAEETERVTQDIQDISRELEQGKNPYGQFAMTYEAACRWRDVVHGADDEKEGHHGAS